MGQKSFIDLGAIDSNRSNYSSFKIFGKNTLRDVFVKKVARKSVKQTFDILINFKLIPSSPGAERFLRLLI